MRSIAEETLWLQTVDSYVVSKVHFVINAARLIDQPKWFWLTAFVLLILRCCQKHHLSYLTVKCESMAKR
jgi:hypothetical protein